MPSFSVPFQVQVADLDPDSPIRRLVSDRLLASVELAPGRWHDRLSFIVDTGATYTTMSATLARASGIPIPHMTSRAGTITAAGQRSGLVHDGELRVRFPQLPGQVFRLYCIFAEDIPPSVPPILGLNDFLDVFRITFDGTPTASAPFGTMRFETLT